MQLHFTGRQLEITPALKEITEKKFQRLTNRFTHIKNIHIIFKVENITHIAEATLDLNGTELHATASDNDMYVAIDELIERLAVQIIKHKEKMTGHHD